MTTFVTGIRRESELLRHHTTIPNMNVEKKKKKAESEKNMKEKVELSKISVLAAAL